MKRIFTLIIAISAMSLSAQKGTRPDSARVIVGSGVTRVIDVLANDIANGARTYTLDNFYYSVTSPSTNITLVKNGNKMEYKDNQPGSTSNDTFFYIAKDQFSVLDTEFVVVRKSDLPIDLYPGDANRDKICNNIDVLNIGIGYGKTNTEREGIYKSDAWAPVRAYDWTPFSQKSNYRFADADGNGTIDSLSDVAVIQKNYNQTDGLPSVSFSPAGGQTFQISTLDTFKVSSPSSTFQIDIRLGTGPTTAVKSYGIAFTVKYDTTYFKANQIQFNPSKWYSDLHNTLNFARVNHSKGEFDLTIVRRDGGNGDGSGSMGIIDVVVVDVLGGLAGGLNTSFEVTKAVLIDSFYNILPVTLAAPKPVHMVKKFGSRVKDVQKDNLQITQDQTNIFVQNQEIKKSEIQIYNILGSQIFRSKDWDSARMTIDTKNWNSGIYIIQYKNEFHKIKIQ
jgi:Secretion system C-terminal sorting domain